MSKVDVETWQRAIGAPVDGDFGPTTLRLSLALIPTPISKPFDERAFFASVRGRFGGLSQAQVDGFKSLLTVMRPWPVSWASYGLGTTWHETAHTMQPIKERGGADYLSKYDTGRLASALGNTPSADGDGQLYAGRGYVQITGRANYRKFGIEATPDDALKPEVAGRILVEGMERGLFTGKKLSDYLPGDYFNARRIINSTDKAQMIADYANDFERALRAGGW